MKKILFGLICLLATSLCPAQIVCDIGNQTNFCEQSETLSVVNGENITEKIKNALVANCEVRIPNLGLQDVVFLVDPMTFSGDLLFKNTSLQKKYIILEEGVVLQTTAGSPMHCSQSMFTFDGEANRYISIIGEYTSCEKRPVLRMPEVVYEADSLMGFLVASDNVDEPYLNDNGEPNFVFSDFDSDPYFDNNGDPNLITPQNQETPVPANCDYNYNLCNRDIIVWCPLNWEGRHLIALHGAQNITIQGLNVENASGGDGIILAASESGAPAKNVLIKDVHYIRNGRTGLNVKSALCLLAENSYIAQTGDQIGIEPFVDINGGVAFEPLADDSLEYFMKKVEFKNSSLAENDTFGIRFNFPSLIDTTYQPELEVVLDSICINNSETAIRFDTSQFDLEGKIEIFNVQIYEVDTAFLVGPHWDADELDVELFNIEMAQDIYDVDVLIDNNSNFCPNLTASDICMAFTDILCGQFVDCDTENNEICTDNSSYACVPSLTPDCPFECTTDIELFACYNQPLLLEAKIDIGDIQADRPLPFDYWRNELNTDHCGLNGDVELCFDFADEQGRTIQVLGLNSDPTTNTHFNSIDYGIYLLTLTNGTHRIRVYENGQLAFSQNTGVDLTGTEFCIKRVNGTIAYFRDGAAFYTSAVTSDELLYFDNSFYSRPTGVWSQGSSTFSNIVFRILNNSSLSWSPGGATTPSIWVSVTEDAIYTASFLNGSADGCKNKFRFDLTVVDTPALTPVIVDPNLNPLAFGTDITICDGEEVILSFEEHLAGNTSYTYDWSTPANSGQTLPIGIAGAFSVTITDTLGCTQFVEFNINVDPLPDVTLTGGHLTCVVTTAYVTGPSGYNYDPPLPFAVNEPGQYCFNVTDPNTGCSIEACAFVTQDITKPDFDCRMRYTDVNGDVTVLNQCDISICPDECVVLTVLGSNHSSFDYQWSPNVNAGNNPWQTEQICNTSGAYSVTITNPVNGCTQVLDYNITVNSLPDVTLTGGHLDCAITSIDITGPAGFQYDPALPFTVTTAGQFCFEVTDPSTGCTAQECATVTQDTTAPNVFCEITYLDDNGNTVVVDDCVLENCPGECAVLAVHGNNLSAYTYNWSNNVTVGASPWLTNDVCGPGTYSVTVTDPTNGCTTELDFTISEGPDCMTICNAGNIAANGGDTLQCEPFPGLQAGQNICFEFFTGSLPDQLIITIGGQVVLNSGLISTTSNTCDNCPACPVTTLSDFGDGNCVPLLVGSGVAVGNTSAGLQLHGTIPITAALANQPIVICVNGTICSAGTGWNLSVDCCEDPGPCISDPTSQNPITTWCESSPTNSGIAWTPVPGAADYEVILDPGQGDCCPNAPAGSSPIVASTTGTNLTLTLSMPNCFTWMVIAYAPNGDVLATSSIECINGDNVLDCNPVDPPNCPNKTPPTEIGCSNVNGVTTVSWTPSPTNTTGYMVTVVLGGSCCPPGGDNDGNVLIFEVSNPIFVIPPELSGQCFTFSIVSLCPDYSFSNPSHTYCYNPQDGCTPDPIITGCEVTDNGTGIVWNSIPGAVNYDVILNPGQGPCCPDAPAGQPPIIGSTTGTSLTVPGSAPDCYTWQVVAYDAMGDVITTSEEVCMNQFTVCTPINPPPCQAINPPTDIGCESADGQTTIFWSNISQNVGDYTVSIQLGGECCTEGGNNEGPNWFFFQVQGNSFTLPQQLVDQCFTFTITTLCPDFIHWTSEEFCYRPEEGCEPKGEKSKARSAELIPQKAFQVFPNPATDLVNISFENFVTEKTNLTIEIINSQSQIVRSIQTSIEGVDDIISINTSDLTSGLYLFKIQNDNAHEVFVEKVVLMK